MTNLLAIETTTGICSVALHLDTRTSAGHPKGLRDEPQKLFLENTRLAPRLHNRHVLTMVDDLLRTASLDKKSLHLIAYGAGPGSFTGVRIGAAVAQGLAFALALPVLPVPSSQVAAETARCAAGLRGTFEVRRKSRAGWRYAARYALCDDGVTCLAFDKLVPDDKTNDDASPSVIDGDRLAIDAGALARVALRTQASAVAPESALPFYVEGDSPWRVSA